MHMPAPSFRLILVFLFTGGLGTVVTAAHEPMGLDWQPKIPFDSTKAYSKELCTGYYLPYQANHSEQNLSTEQPQDTNGDGYINMYDMSFGEEGLRYIVDVEKIDNQQPLYSSADKSEYDKGIAEFKGNVEFRQGDRQVEGDSARFDQNDGFVDIDGHVTMRRPNMIIQSQAGRFNTNDSEARLNLAQLAVPISELRAKAQTIDYPQDDTVTMREGSFTFCAPGDTTWAIHSSQIDLDPESGMAEAQHAILKIGVVPVFYLPWMSFPIDDQRRSGFLFPTLESGSSTGLDVTTPYYLNLALNYDALITPRFTELGGSSLNTKFRYLGHGVKQKLELDIAIDDLNADKKRWLLDYNNEAKINAQLTSSIDVKRISDFELLNDYGLAHEAREKTSIISKAALNYQGKTPILKTASLAIISRQNGGTEVPAYNQFPHLTVSGGGAINPVINTDYFLDLAHFTRDTEGLTGRNKITGIRTHLVPSFSTSWITNYIFIKPKLSIPMTHFELNDTPSSLSSSETRVIPQFEIDSGLLFERNIPGGYLQTLEPRLYFAFAAYEYQDDLASFDSSINAKPLYSPNRFNGFDRIGDTNRVTVGLDSQFLNAKGWQKAKLSVSQMHYFNDRQVQASNASVTSTEILSPIYGAMAYNFSREWTSNLGVTWSPGFDDVETTSAHMRYQPSNRKVIDFNYTETRKGAQQAEVSLMWPIAPQWTLLAKRKEDIRNQQLQDEIVGVRYVNCCWQASLVNRQWLVDQVNGIGSGAGIEHGIFLELSLKGLGQTNKQLTPGKKQSLEVIMKSIAGYNEYVNEYTQ